MDWQNILFILFVRSVGGIKASNNENPVSLSRAIESVISSTNVHDVSCIVDDSNNDESSNVLIGEIFRIVAPLVPVRSMTLNDFSRDPPTGFLSSSRTLFIHVCTRSAPPDAPTVDRFIDLTRLTTYRSHQPRILQVSASRDDAVDFAPTLRRYWSRNLLYATIVQLTRSKSETPRALLSTLDSTKAERDERTVYLHDYNPFTNRYSKTPYSETYRWFREKLRDMHGHPLVYNAVSRPPFSDVEYDSQYRVKRFGGVDGEMLRTVASVVNFTARTEPMNRSYVDGTVQTHFGLIRDVVAGKALLNANTNLMTFIEELGHVRFGAPYGCETICAAAPLIRLDRVRSVPLTTCLALLATAAIVLIYWLLAIALGFDASTWTPYNILQALLALSMPSEPRRADERVTLLFVFAVSSYYMSIFYTELMNVGLDTSPEMQFRDLADLARAKVTPVLHSNMYLMLNSYRDARLNLLAEVAVPTESLNRCYDELIRFKNASCVATITRARFKMLTNTYNGRPLLKITDICYWQYPTGIIHYEYSPYAERLDEVMSRIFAAGFRQRWMRDYVMTTTHTNIREDTEDHFTINRLLIFLAAAGFSSSFLAFLVELIVGRFGVCRGCRSAHAVSFE